MADGGTLNALGWFDAIRASSSGASGGTAMMPFNSNSQDPNRNQPASSTGVGAYSPVQLLFLMRLARLLRERQEWLDRLPPDDWRVRLLHKSIYSSFRDCLELGVGEDARNLFEQYSSRAAEMRRPED